MRLNLLSLPRAKARGFPEVLVSVALLDIDTSYKVKGVGLPMCRHQELPALIRRDPTWCSIAYLIIPRLEGVLY